MDKPSIIREIARLQGSDCNRSFLRRKSVYQLLETLARWRAIAATTQAEINRHCQPYPLRKD